MKLPSIPTAFPYKTRIAPVNIDDIATHQENISAIAKCCFNNIPNTDWLHDSNNQFEFRKEEDLIHFLLVWK